MNPPIKKKRNRRPAAVVLAEKERKARELLASKGETIPVVENNGGSEVFQPLPPIAPVGSLDSSSGPTSDNSGSGKDLVVPNTTAQDQVLKQGLAELVSEDVPRLLNNGIILFGLDERVEVNPISPGRAALWSEFALPWLRKYFPTFDDDIMFWILTGSMLGSMVSIKKKDKGVIDVKRKEETTN